MNAYDDSALARISLRAPVITVVLAATAIPIELRPLGRAALSYQIWASDVVGFVSDVVMNVGAYVLVGIVLAGLGQWWAVLVATSMATFAESAQFVMMHRDPRPSMWPRTSSERRWAQWRARAGGFNQPI